MIDKLSNWFSDIVEGLTPKQVFLFILAVEAVIVWLLWDRNAPDIAAKIAIGSFIYWTLARFFRRLITATRHWRPLASVGTDSIDFDHSKEILIGEKERNRLKGIFGSIRHLVPEFYGKNRVFFENMLEQESIEGALGYKLHNFIYDAERCVASTPSLSPKQKLHGMRFLRCARMHFFVEVVSGYKKDRLPIFHYLLGIPTLYDQEEEDCL